MRRRSASRSCRMARSRAGRSRRWRSTSAGHRRDPLRRKSAVLTRSSRAGSGGADRQARARWRWHGRAFPELQMSTHFIDGAPCVPAALVDRKEQPHRLQQHHRPAHAGKVRLRDLCIRMGCHARLAMPCSRGHQAKTLVGAQYAVAGKAVGDAVLAAHRASKAAMTEAILAVTGGSELFCRQAGRRAAPITVTSFAVASWWPKGWGRSATAGIARGLPEREPDRLAGQRPQRAREVVACVPDLICIIESRNRRTDHHGATPLRAARHRAGHPLLRQSCARRPRSKWWGRRPLAIRRCPLLPMPKVAGIGIE